MLKICVYTTNRAEYSKLRPILKLLQKDSDIELSLLVTGSHLLKEYGESKKQIINDGINITEEINKNIKAKIDKVVFSSIKTLEYVILTI